MSVCLSVNMPVFTLAYLKNTHANFMAVARSSSDDSAIRCVPFRG